MRQEWTFRAKVHAEAYACGLRMVEGPPAARGRGVSDETVRRRAASKFSNKMCHARGNREFLTTRYTATMGRRHLGWASPIFRDAAAIQFLGGSSDGYIAS